MMFSNVIVDITISRLLFVFLQSRVKVSACLADVGGNLAVKAFESCKPLLVCRMIRPSL